MEYSKVKVNIGNALKTVHDSWNEIGYAFYLARNNGSCFVFPILTCLALLQLQEKSIMEVNYGTVIF